MPTISASENLCTVIATVDAPGAIMAGPASHAREGLQASSRYPGFVAGALHLSADGGRLIQYLQWASEADHLAWMNDPRWDELSSTKEFRTGMTRAQARHQ